jgi:acyl-CoA reductase-like NAD-dependent aldehyde dehydrogenase
VFARFRYNDLKVDAAVEGLYRARDSAKASHLLARLTPEERQEVFTRVGERIERDKARFSQLLAKKDPRMIAGVPKTPVKHSRRSEIAAEYRSELRDLVVLQLGAASPSTPPVLN